MMICNMKAVQVYNKSLWGNELNMGRQGVV